MKTIRCENKFGKFSITHFPNGDYEVKGNVSAAVYAFKSINRRPPNEYGNFYGREKAGFKACQELIKIVEDGGTDFIRRAAE